MKVPDKLGAVQQLAKMCDWNSPDKLEIGAGDSLKKYLMELRMQPLVSGGTSIGAGDGATQIIELENGENGEEIPRESQ